MSIQRKIRKAFDWYEYVAAKYETTATSNPDEVRINCVSCGETDAKLYVHTERGLFHCFKCDFSSRNYDLFDFIAKTEGVNRLEAMRIASDLCRLSVPVNFDDAVRLELERSSDSTTDMPVLSGPRTISAMPQGAVLLRDHMNSEALRPFILYLLGRGLTETEICNYQIYATPSAKQPYYDATGKYRFNIGGRVLFPIYSPDRDLVSWIGRAVSSGEKIKYVNAPDTDLNKTFWPASSPWSDHVVLVEGVLDCMAMRRLPPPLSAYTTFGKSVSKEQVSTLLSWNVKEVTLFWDIRDAKPEMVRTAERLSTQFQCVNVLDMSSWDRKQDPGDMLSNPAGTAILANTVSRKIRYGTTEFLKWQIQ